MLVFASDRPMSETVSLMYSATRALLVVVT
jgi:hypothetical protein